MNEHFPLTSAEMYSHTVHSFRSDMKYVDQLREIQLESIRHGMMLAAETCLRNNNSGEGLQCHEAILTAAKEFKL